MVATYLLDIIYLLIAAVIAVPLSQAARLGAVPGFLIAGALVGPYGMKLVSKVSEISHLAEIGVVFLLFVIGMELKPTRLWQMRRLVFGLGTLQVLLTGFILGLVSHVVFGLSLPTAILVGPALALSSTAFVLQLLSSQRLLTSSYGRTSISILLLQDLAVVPLLALVPLLAMPELNIGEEVGLALVESLLILALVVLLGRYLLHPILHRVALSGNPEVFTASAVLIVLGTAYITEHAGLSMAMGAFLAGLLISDSSYRHQILTEIQPFRGLLLGLFFMSMGMSLNLNLLTTEPLQSVSIVFLLMLIKALVLFPLAYWFGIRNKCSIAVSLVLAQSGEFALVLFSLAYQSEILSELLFQQLILIVLLSMLFTPFLAHLAEQIVKKREAPKDDNTAPPEEAPIVIAGFGRMGTRIGEILSLADKPFVALDSDATIVEKGRTKGYPVFYGDVRNSELLRAAGASNAEVIIVTLNDTAATESVVSSLRKAYPHITIFARGQGLSQCRELRQLGATGVVSENVEASIELARMALSSSGVSENKRNAILDNFHRAYHAQINEVIVEKQK